MSVVKPERDDVISITRMSAQPQDLAGCVDSFGLVTAGGCTLPNRSTKQIQPEARQLCISLLAHSAKDLNRLVSAKGGCLRGSKLGHCCFFDEALSVILEVCSSVRQEPGAVKLHRHVRELKLDGL